eukprot:gene8877-18379_t
MAAAPAPTFEDLSIDDNLPALDRLVRYSQSTIGLQRLVHVKMLADVASTVGFANTRDHIIPLLVPLSKDSEPAVRQHLCEQLIPLSKFCLAEGGHEGYRILLEKLIPTCAKELEYEKAEVRQSACYTMVALAKSVQPEELGKDVLTIVLRLAHEDDNEEMRMTACELLNLLAEQLGQDLCQQFVIPEIVSLAEDPNFRVRKSTALNFQNICKIGGEHELFERLMPAFVRLSKDDVYRVRKACGESLAKISQHVNDDIRSGVLVEIFLRLAQDMSKPVKHSVLSQSGYFISTLPKKVISEVILGHFSSLSVGAMGDSVVDAELRHHCAHSFPAVLYTIGAERWQEIYHRLVQCQNLNVRITLALSLHEIAKILGSKVVEEELLSVFEEMIQPMVMRGPWERVRVLSTAEFFGGCVALPMPSSSSSMNEETTQLRMQQDVEAVRIGVLRYLADFLRLLSQPCRISYLPLFNEILHSTNPFNWRLRQTLASQLPDLMSLPPPHNVYSTLFPLAMTLLQDPVAHVRRETFRGVAKMLIVLQGHAVSDIDADTMDTEGGGGEGGVVDMHAQTSQTQSLSSPLSLSVPPVPSALPSAPMQSPVSNRTQQQQIQSTISTSRLRQGEEYVTAVARAINALTFGDTFQQRQLWVELCHRLLHDLPQDIFETHFVEGLVRLTSDPVLNVRVAVAVLLGGWAPENLPPWEVPDPNLNPVVVDGNGNGSGNGIDITATAGVVSSSKITKASPWTYLMKRPDVRSCVERLSRDDRDVYNCVKKLQPLFPDIQFSSISCRGRKMAPGGAAPVSASNNGNNNGNDNDSTAVLSQTSSSSDILMSTSSNSVEGFVLFGSGSMEIEKDGVITGNGTGTGTSATLSSLTSSLSPGITMSPPGKLLMVSELHVDEVAMDVDVEALTEQELSSNDDAMVMTSNTVVVDEETLVISDDNNNNSIDNGSNEMTVEKGVLI